jgi:hypothetical protein
VTTRFRSGVVEAVVIAALFGAALFTSQAALRAFRTAGAESFFYQANFEAAVMMACGRGFVTSSATPQELVDFLNVARDDFDCTRLPQAMPERPLTSPANANWYYLYGAAAGVWRLTGVSWTALDILVCGMSAAVAVLLYGLFRLIASRTTAVAVAAILTLSPANLTHLLSLRDYSKAPFVLAGVLILAALVMRPMPRPAMVGLAALYGVVVGLGYGFRGDLAVMVPFGAFVVLLLLPGTFRANAGRNALAAAALLAAFFASAWPVINGLKLGGCQYHFSLLGLTEPLTAELRLTPSLYRVGEHLSDTFADLKVGDYAARVLGAPVPGLCTAEYDTASGRLYLQIARTFPADFVVRAYASVLMILRVGLAIPAAMLPMPPFPTSDTMTAVYRLLNGVTSILAPAGVLVTAIAVAGAWASSIRLGMALTVFVLFLTGYPAIRFDERHWFHLRFIPWWAAVLVATQVLQSGRRVLDRPRVLRAVAAISLLLAALAVALGALRVLQTRRVEHLITQYLGAPLELLPAQAEDGSSLRVDWQPSDYGVSPAHRASDLVVVTLDSAACAGTGPLGVSARYVADVSSHDMSTSFSIPRPTERAAPTKLFVPVFQLGAGDRIELRFSGLQVTGAPVACIGQVGRISHDAALPLWLDLQVPADWANHRLYQSMRLPRLLDR